ncbi:MAG: hypothetical protein AABX51_09220 [Nanoarchaeota archaeon]
MTNQPLEQRIEAEGNVPTQTSIFSSLTPLGGLIGFAAVTALAYEIPLDSYPDEAAKICLSIVSGGSVGMPLGLIAGMVTQYIAETAYGFFHRAEGQNNFS